MVKKINKSKMYSIVNAKTKEVVFQTDNIGELLGELTGCKSFGECFMEKKVDNKKKPIKKKGK